MKLKVQSFLNENYVTVHQYLMLTLLDLDIKNLAAIYHNIQHCSFPDLLRIHWCFNLNTSHGSNFRYLMKGKSGERQIFHMAVRSLLPQLELVGLFNAGSQKPPLGPCTRCRCSLVLSARND